MRINLTPTYMNKRRVKGLCYFCDEPFTYVHTLTRKKIQLHMVEVEDDEDEETLLQSNTLVRQTLTTSDFEEAHIFVIAPLTRIIGVGGLVSIVDKANLY